MATLDKTLDLRKPSAPAAASLPRVQHQLNDYLLRANQVRCKVGVFLLELGTLQELARSLGPVAIEEITARSIRRLRRVVGNSGLVSFISSNIVVVLAPDLKSSDEATVLADAMHDAVSRPYDFGEIPIYIRCSVGLAMYPDHGRTPVQLMSKAEAALACTGNATGEYLCSYDGAKHENDTDRLLISSGLEQALEAREFQLHYQPRISTATGELTGAEALLRWFNPVLGEVKPDDYIPVAEQTGLLEKIWRWMVEAAAAQYREWLEEGLSLPILSLRLPSRKLMGDGPLDSLVKAQAGALPAGAKLELELEELLMLGGSPQVRKAFRSLGDGGVGLAIGGFASGYSALPRLSDLPVETLIIEHGLVRGAGTSAENATLIASMVKMARELDLRLVARGVDRPEQLARLTRLGCTEVQGEHVSMPLTAREMAARLAGGEEPL